MQIWTEPVKIVETRARRTRTRRVLRPYARYPTSEALLATAIARMNGGE